MKRIPILALAMAALLLAACSGGGTKPKPASVASPDATAAETSAPVPTPSPSSGQLPFRPAPAAFARLSYAPGQAIDAKHGVFFMDTNTGAVEGWRLSDAAILADGDDPADCCYFATVSDDNRFIAVRTSKTSWLLDRKSGKAISWEPGRMAFVSSSPHYLLFERAANPGFDPNPEFDGRYTIVDENFAPVSAFKLERGGRGLPRVLFSPDERTLIIPAGNKSWSDYTGLQQVDVATGAVRSLANLPAVPPGYSPGPPKFLGLEKTDEFAVTIRYGPQFDAPKSAAGDLPNLTLVRRYSWSGTLLAEFELPTTGVSLSPDGKLLAYEQMQRSVTSEADSPTEYWSNVVVADGRTGSVLLRVRSASLYYGDGLGDARWLADSSAIPVAVRPRSSRAADVPHWRNVSFSLLVPNEGRVQALDLAENALLAPIPAPDRPGLFAVGHTGVLELGSGRQVAAKVSGEIWFGHVPPWGKTSAEIRFALPHGGHGGGGPGTFLSPRIEYPPFDDRFAFRVTGTGSCLNLRSLPSGSASTSGCLPDGSGVALSDPPPGLPYGKLAAWFADETLWIHIRIASGEEGWVSSEYLRW